jgi:hypothetical protein
MTIDSLLEIAKLAVVGLVAGFFTSYVGNRDYRYRKWWELRVAAYQSVIESLSDMHHSYSTFFNAHIENRDIPKEREKELQNLISEGYARVRKAADTGAFLFSNDVANALEDYRRSRDKRHTSYFEHLDDGCDETRKCLEKIVSCSKRDLQLQNYFVSLLKS